MTGLTHTKKHVTAAATKAVAASPSAASRPDHVTVTEVAAAAGMFC